MNSISIMAAHVYISFAGMERFNDQTFKMPGLNAWIEENLTEQRCNYAKWVREGRARYMVGIYLCPEEATLFKLKFGL